MREQKLINKVKLAGYGSVSSRLSRGCSVEAVGSLIDPLVAVSTSHTARRKSEAASSRPASIPYSSICRLWVGYGVMGGQTESYGLVMGGQTSYGWTDGLWVDERSYGWTTGSYGLVMGGQTIMGGQTGRSPTSLYSL